MIALSYIAEFLGTFALTSAFFFVGNWLFMGLALAFISWAIIGISGAHVNPAITFSSWLSGALSGQKALFYGVSQLLGSALALYMFRLLA